jgi:hypothetical protein
MKKLSLDPEDLRVESFGTTADPRAAPGTVHAHDEQCGCSGQWSCNTCWGQETCDLPASCDYTCDNASCGDTCADSCQGSCWQRTCACEYTQYFTGGCESFDRPCYPV